MKVKLSRVDVWATALEDRPGQLAARLEILANAGVDLEFVVARRESSRPGAGVVFITPIRGAAQVKAARQAGFIKTDSMNSVRVSCPDKPGLGLRLTAALADAGINLRGLSAAAVGKNAVAYLAFDSAADARSAMRIIKGLK